MTRSLLFTTLVAGCLGLSACASAPDAPAAGTDYLGESATRVGPRFFTGPQPALEDLAPLRAAGVKRVVSLRTPEEMEELAFDQGEALAALGMDYVHIPVGGDDHPYSPAQLDTLAAALDRDDATTLLHCRSGWRASVLLVAYLVEHRGMDVNDAVRHAQGWWPLALEDLTGREYALREVPPGTRERDGQVVD